MQSYSRASTVGLAPLVDASQAIVVVVGELTARLTPGETHRLLEHLPRHLGELLSTCEARRGHGPVHRLRDRPELIACIAKRLGTTPAVAESIAVDVLMALRDELPSEVADHVAAQLPRNIKDLWLARAPIVAATDYVSAEGARDLLEREIEARVALPSHVAPSAAFTAVMTTLFERLSGGEALHVLLGLPEELRPLLEGAVIDRVERPHRFGRDELFAMVAERLEVTRGCAAEIVPAVLGAVKHVLPRKEIDDVAAQLPNDLRDLWVAAD